MAFDQLVSERMTQSKNILSTKESEYARQSDRLHNFKRAGACQGVTPEHACIGMWMKHVISIIDMVQDINSGSIGSKNLWDEKLNDAHNYLYLLEGLLNERTWSN